MSAPVLICDDDPIQIKLITRLLEVEGIAAQGYSSSSELLASIPVTEARVLLLDISMPGINGFEILELIAGQKDQATGPAVIMLTAHSMRQQVLKAVNLGATGYLLKPVDRQALLENVLPHVIDLTPAEVRQLLSGVGDPAPDLSLDAGLVQFRRTGQQSYKVKIRTFEACLLGPPRAAMAALEMADDRSIAANVAILMRVQKGWRQVWPRQKSNKPALI